MQILSIAKRPSAILPMALSLAALAVVLGRIALAGPTPGVDEGTAAHVFQLLLVTEVPLILWLVVKWLPRAPHWALQVVALQLLFGLAALAPVYYFHL